MKLSHLWLNLAMYFFASFNVSGNFFYFHLHGSVVVPMLFSTYIKPLPPIINSHYVMHLSFTDYLQLQVFAPLDKTSNLLYSMQSCISDITALATANMLRLNNNKTELMLVNSEKLGTIGNAHIPFKQSLH